MFHTFCSDYVKILELKNANLNALEKMSMGPPLNEKRKSSNLNSLERMVMGPPLQERQNSKDSIKRTFSDLLPGNTDGA